MEDRDQAIRDLADALARLAQADQTGQDPSVRMTLGPAAVFTAADTDLYCSIDLTPKAAQSLADAVDSMNAYLADGEAEDAIHIDEDHMARSTARFTGWLQGQTGEAIASGDWSASAVAQNNPELYTDVIDLFLLLDPIEITDKVIRDREASLCDVAQTLDDLFGDIPYPYDEEDVPLPHDQAQMDALADEAEQYLSEGGE